MAMMQVVVDRGIDPFADPVLMESFGIQLETQMAIDIVKNHEQQKGQKRRLVKGNQKNNQKNDRCLHDRL